MANAKRTPIQAREFATELQPLTDRHALAVQMARDSVRSLEMKAASGIAAANNLIAMNQAKVPDSPRLTRCAQGLDAPEEHISGAGTPHYSEYYQRTNGRTGGLTELNFG